MAIKPNIYQEHNYNAKPKLLNDSLNGSRGTFNVIDFFYLFADIITGKLWLLKLFMDNKVNKFVTIQRNL